ncbi:Uncharacterised protein [Mycobacterium tuberculosis]|nr:Uncharacterised protein [Mycobacterium tuberculosis]
MVRRRRNQSYARRHTAYLSYPRIYLGAGKLPSFAGLGALGHFDLNLIRIDEIIACYAKAAGCHLLDRTTPQVAILIGLIALRMLSTFAGIALAANPVHGDREALVRFLRN